MQLPDNYIAKNVLVVIPVYNEAEYVSDILEAVSQYHKNIIIVNDGSDDGTEKILNEYKSIQVITHKTNEGYGQSLIDAFEFAKCRNYKWVITMDCDCQHEPLCIPEFFHEIIKNNTDIISGSRYLLGANTKNVPMGRLHINRRITTLLNSILKINITDAFCGFKAYRVSVFEKLRLTEKGYGLPLQFWVQAAFLKLRIAEISVPLIYHDPKRNFAGLLEFPAYRMRYYMDIIKRELDKYDFKNTGKLFHS